MLVVGAVLAIGLLAGISAIVFANDLSAGPKTGNCQRKGRHTTGDISFSERYGRAGHGCFCCGVYLFLAGTASADYSSG